MGSSVEQADPEGEELMGGASYFASFSLDVIKIMKSNMMRWVGHVARMGEMNACSSSVVYWALDPGCV
jgi:hypothetical protein